MLAPTLPAEAAKPCDCCKRIHRKLVLVNGFWLGQSCADDYRRYLNTPAYYTPVQQAAIWHGYETKLSKIKRMIGA